MSNPSRLPPDLQKIHDRLDTDLVYFAERAPLKIKDKEGNVIPFRLNKAQKFIHAALEKQLKERGRIRACILKGRQQGCSTYVSARYYHKTTRRKGISTFILSHEGKTTAKLFRMVKRYQENLEECLRPEEGSSNVNTMTFSSLDSDYSVGTAGNENVGRGGTAQLFHGSEAGYWEKADEIQDGALNAIGDVPGTEIILESTANGPLGLFYRKCMDAMRGVGDYVLIFVPWFWQDEYERDYSGEELTEEEQKYMEQYILPEYPKAKALRKIMWRRFKIIDLKTADNLESGLMKFRQIYPANPIEAFQSSGVSLVRADAISAARKSKIQDEFAPKVLGVDPAGESDNSDRTALVLRQGRAVTRFLKYSRMNSMELAGIVIRLIQQEDIDMVFIDRGYGQGTIDRLHELGHRDRVIGVAFNERPSEPDRFLNKRSEMIIQTAEWVNGGGVSIPDDDEFHADLASMPLDSETSNGLKYIPTKREIKKILGRSPDIYDGLALTFAYPVRRKNYGGSGKGVENYTGFRKKDLGYTGTDYKGPLASRARKLKRH